MANEANGDLGNTWLKTHSATSGAYRLVSWKPNESVTLEANSGYHLGLAKTKRVIIRHVPEPGSQQLLLEKGDIDIALSLQPDQFKPLVGSNNVNIESFPSSGTWYIGLNLADARLKNPKVRLAILTHPVAARASHMASNGNSRASHQPTSNHSVCYPNDLRDPFAIPREALHISVLTSSFPGLHMRGL